MQPAPPGGTFGAAVDLSAAGQTVYGPQIAVAPDGTATVVWRRSTSHLNTRIIAAATRPPGASFGAVVNLSAPGQERASCPQIAIGPDGAATALWRRYDGANFIVQSASTATASINKVSVSGPANVKKGRVVTYRVRITNSRRAAVTGVRLKVSGRGVKVNARVGKIAAGRSRTVKVRVRLRRPGRIKVAFRATSSNAVGKTVKKTIKVKR